MDIRVNDEECRVEERSDGVQNGSVEYATDQPRPKYVRRVILSWPEDVSHADLETTRHPWLVFPDIMVHVQC